MVLLKDDEFHHGLGLVVHIRTKIRYDYSYIESVAVAFGGGDGGDILEVSSFGQYMVNGVSNAMLPLQLADNKFSLTRTRISDKQESFEIQMGDGNNSKEGIVISTFKDMVAIKLLNATQSNFGNSTGLMGNFDTGAMLGRDGSTVFGLDNVAAFGQEWQVRDTEAKLFQTKTRDPQYPSPCVLPMPKKVGRRLGEGISKVAAEEACLEWTGDKKERCIYDVMATNDLEVAHAYGAY